MERESRRRRRRRPRIQWGSAMMRQVRGGPEMLRWGGASASFGRRRRRAYGLRWDATVVYFEHTGTVRKGGAGAGVKAAHPSNVETGKAVV